MCICAICIAFVCLVYTFHSFHPRNLPLNLKKIKIWHLSWHLSISTDMKNLYCICFCLVFFVFLLLFFFGGGGCIAKPYFQGLNTFEILISCKNFGVVLNFLFFLFVCFFFTPIVLVAVDLHDMNHQGPQFQLTIFFSVELKKKSHLHLDGMRVSKLTANFHFGVKYPFILHLLKCMRVWLHVN